MATRKNRGLQIRTERQRKHVDALFGKFSDAASVFTSRRQRDSMMTNNTEKNRQAQGSEMRIERRRKHVDALFNKFSKAASQFTSGNPKYFLPTNNNVEWLVAWLNMPGVPGLRNDFAKLIGAMNESAHWHDSLSRRMHVGGRLEGVRSFFALQAIEALSKDGSLRQIRQCQSCARWLFAKNRRQRFCSGPCREKAFRKSDEGKAKRAAYMSGYRERLKRMEDSGRKFIAKAPR
jgi:hypothetical protein